MAPPFRDLTPAETDDVVAELAASDADIIWVGLGMPRQEKWMHQIAPRLPGKTLVGVGAAFDLLSGTVPQAPPLLQRPAWNGHSGSGRSHAACGVAMS